MLPAPPFPLLQGEKMLYQGRRSWRSEFWWLLLGVLTIWLFGLGLIFIIKAIFDVYGSYYVITNKRIYARYGVIRRYENHFRVEWGMDAVYYQGFWGRLLGYGDVWASNPGRTGIVILKGVKSPRSVNEIILKVIELEKLRSKVMEKIERIEEEYKLGKVSEDKYLALKKEYEEELAKIESSM